PGRDERWPAPGRRGSRRRTPPPPRRTDGSGTAPNPAGPALPGSRRRARARARREPAACQSLVPGRAGILGPRPRRGLLGLPPRPLPRLGPQPPERRRLPRGGLRVALQPVRARELVVRALPAGIDLDRRLQVRDRLVHATLSQEQLAELVVRAGMTRVG